MREKHPTYSNPTIQEAIFELHYEHKGSTSGDSSFFAEFFKKIQSHFPIFEPVQQMGLQLLIGPQGFSQSSLPREQRMRYRNENGNLLLQLSSSVFVLNVLPKYPKWTEVKKLLLENWNHLLSITEPPTTVTRIGMRYLNRISRESNEETPGVWLEANEYIPSAVMTSFSPVFSRVELKPTKERSLLVTLTEAVEQDKEVRPFIFDIDCIAHTQLPISGNEVSETLEALHETVWNVFAVSKGTRLEELLMRKQ